MNYFKFDSISDNLYYYYTFDYYDEYRDYGALQFLLEDFFGDETCEAFVASRWNQNSGQQIDEAFNENPDLAFMNDFDSFAAPGKGQRLPRQR